METNIQSQLTETTQPVVEPNLNGINVYGSKTDDGIIKDLTMSLQLNSCDLQELCWLNIKVKLLSFDSEYCELNPNFAFQLASQYGQVIKVLPKPPPYQDSCFIKMANVVEAGKVKKALDGTTQSKYRMQVKFFSSPDLKQKLMGKPLELKPQPKIESFQQVPPRCLQVCYQKGCVVSEMHDYMILNDPQLSQDYKSFLKQIKNQLRIVLHNTNTLQASFLTPQYCERFAFTHQFIGTNGKYIKQIRSQCQDQVGVSVNVVDKVIQISVSGKDPLLFIKAVRLCQERLVQVFEMFLIERNRVTSQCCQKNFKDEDPKNIFIQPFFAKKTQVVLQTFIDLQMYNAVCLADFKQDLL